ncbi:class I adenylate-forming enzyme family protein [Desulfocicer niacini]
MKKFTYNSEMFIDVFENEFTYINGFLRNVHRHSNRTAITCPERGKSWTYPQLNQESNRLANAMIADGVRKQDVVMYQLLNCAEFAFLYLAPQKIGAVNCPINFRLSYGETAYTIDDSKPKIFFYDSEVKEMCEKALNTASHKPEKVVMIDVSGKEKPFAGSISYDEYVRDASDDDPSIERPTHIYDETTRLYTSGTTGMPKGVPLNNVCEIMSAHDVLMHFPLSSMDKTMNMTPWFHRGGLYSGGPNPTLYAGGEIVVLRNFDPRVVLSHVEKYGVTFLIGAPVTLKAIHDEQLRETRDLSKLKGIVTMGAPLERNACIEFQKILTPNIFNGYGSTEAFWNTFLRPHDLPRMAGTAGKSCTDDDMAVVKLYPDRFAEPSDVVAKDNETVGEVIIKAPGKCSYDYLNKPEEAEKKFYKGWVYIGDLATWNEEEFVTIVGRKDDMLISGGENIQPAQVEEAINEYYKVEECVVTGVPDKKWGQVVVAYVIRKDASLTVSELDEFCRQHPMLARYKRPKYYKFTEAIDLTATGKKIHYKAKAKAEEDMKKGKFEKV